MNTRLGNVHTLLLTNNDLYSLYGLAKLYSLVKLDVRSNIIEHVRRKETRRGEKEIEGKRERREKRRERRGGEKEREIESRDRHTEKE